MNTSSSSKETIQKKSVVSLEGASCSKSWGFHLSLDLAGCPKEKIASAENITAWVKTLVDDIDMKAYGEPDLEHFATHSFDSAGYTLTQLIETSNICAHFAENKGEAYIDIFSCKRFEAKQAESVCRSFFEPTKIKANMLVRGDWTRGERFIEPLHHNQIFQGFEIKETLFERESDFQHVKVVDTERLGRVLMLDEIVQTTEMDEAAYHEMLTHVPLCALESAKKVMIVGGGDGGVLREVLKHPVQQVDMVELDSMVVEASIEFLPRLNDKGAIYKDPRATLYAEDAFGFLERTKSETYDLIIVDSTDPIGEAEKLFSVEFYDLVANALKKGGIVTTQSGVASLQGAEIRETLSHFKDVGLVPSTYTTVVPTYYGGYMMLGFGQKTSLHEQPPSLETIRSRTEHIQGTLRHYTPELHLASFALPVWIQNIVAEFT